MRYKSEIQRIILWGMWVLMIHVSMPFALWAGETPKKDTQQSDTEDFDLFGDQPKALQNEPIDPEIARKAEKRRWMLKTHQALGLGTLTLMTATSVVGQLNYNDIYADTPSGTGDYLWPHRILGYSTAVAFATTAGFSLLAPEPFEKHDGFDTATIHKIAVTGATLGMLTQIGLGFFMARRAEAGNQSHLDQFAKIHQITGYTTTGFMAIAATVWLF